MEHSTASVTVTTMQSGVNKPYINPDDVNFKVEYSKDYKGVKHMVDGEITIINKDLAADFEKRGIGHIVTDGDQKQEEGTGDPADDKKVYSKMKKDELHAELTARSIAFDPASKNADLVLLLEANDTETQKAK